ncbi:MAG: signal peptidase I [Lachnospiraceae bacterium]
MAKRGLSFRRRKALKKEVVHTIWICLLGSLLAALIGFGITFAVGNRMTNIGTSMESTILHGQDVLVNRVSYRLGGPKVDDVIVFLPSIGSTDHYYIKRVVACEGDTVQIINGYLYINGEYTDSGYDRMIDAGIASEMILLDEDEYFVLGDNRNKSEDSRSTTIGIVNLKDIYGTVWFTLKQGDGAIGFV